MALAATTPYTTAVALETDQDRWDAIIRRDAAAENTFFYSVETTGIYCRPGCPARLPHRQNVRFYSTCRDAERAGFRPCQRCRPNQPSLAAQHADAIEKACRFIEAQEQAPSLDRLAEASGMSRFHFHRLFKSITGLTPKAYADAHRARRVREQLAQSDTVTAAIYNAGYNSQGRFYAAAGDLLGMTPTGFRAGGKDLAVRFAIGECSLGSILVASTEKGVCAILLGDEPEQLIRELEKQYPQAELIGGDAAFEALVGQAIALVEQPRQSADLPLDIQGTAFQQRVWQALRQIPAGTTLTYAQVAERIGSPGAVRAVAHACATNSIAVAIPCHRVVRSNGSLAGYRWGIDRKQSLLTREAAQ